MAKARVTRMSCAYAAGRAIDLRVSMPGVRDTKGNAACSVGQQRTTISAIWRLSSMVNVNGGIAWS